MTQTLDKLRGPPPSHQRAAGPSVLTLLGGLGVCSFGFYAGSPKKAGARILDVQTILTLFVVLLNRTVVLESVRKLLGNAGGCFVPAVHSR